MENHNTDNHYDVYDEVLEYLLDEGYSFEEANKIMVSIVDEDWKSGAAKFVLSRLKTPLKTAATDLATTAISLTGLGKGKPPITRVPSPSTTQIVKQVPPKPSSKPPTSRTTNIPNPWKGQSSGSRLSNVLRGGETPRTPSPQPRLTGSTSNVKGALPSGTRGGDIVKTIPSSSAITSNRTPKASIQPKLTGSTSKGALPSGTRGGSITQTPSKPTEIIKATKPSTSVSAKTPIQPVKVKDITQEITKSQDLRKLSPSTQGTKTLPAAKKPTPGAGKPPRGIRGLGGLAGAGLGAVAMDMAFPEPTAPGTKDTAPKLPTTAKEVKKGETYYDPSTRVGSSQRFAQRKKVGPKIVGPKLSAAQDFDKTYAQAKQKGGMGSTFDWRGGKYKVY